MNSQTAFRKHVRTHRKAGPKIIRHPKDIKNLTMSAEMDRLHSPIINIK